jgi:hypothetical protein
MMELLVLRVYGVGGLMEAEVREFYWEERERAPNKLSTVITRGLMP